jgi:ABC-type polar amino acid transport system ATPase subunit
MGERSVTLNETEVQTETETANGNQVTLRGVTKRYGSRTVLDDISMTIGSGQTAALIGPSGGGKSTILRCINGLNAFEAGQITVGPHVLEANAPAASTAPIRRLFGMIFQDFQLFPHMTAQQNVMEAPIQVLGLSQREAVERSRALLARVGLADRADYYPRQLSGGQKQRVAIARALAMEPRGLLCDEITSALDPELKVEVLNTLEDLKQDGLTLIMVTHEIFFARRAADRVFLLADGKIAEEGTPDEVIGNPQTPRAQRFIKQVLA